MPKSEAGLAVQVYWTMDVVDNDASSGQYIDWIGVVSFGVCVPCFLARLSHAAQLDSGRRQGEQQKKRKEKDQ